MKIVQVKFRNSIAMPDTNTGNTEHVKVQEGTTIELLAKSRCIAIRKAGFELATIVPLEQVAWMKAEPETEAEPTSPPKRS